MDWLLRTNRALDYIESNLTGEIELKEVARSACCSSHQFQRMFSFITNVSLAEYIRRRHGVNPASAREEGTALKAYPRLSFLISIRGKGNELSHRDKGILPRIWYRKMEWNLKLPEVKRGTILLSCGLQ